MADQTDDPRGFETCGVCGTICTADEGCPCSSYEPDEPSPPMVPTPEAVERWKWWWLDVVGPVRVFVGHRGTLCIAGPNSTPVSTFTEEWQGPCLRAGEVVP